MKKALALFAVLCLSACDLLSPKPTPEQEYKPQAIDKAYPIRMMLVRPAISTVSASRGWGVMLINTSDSAFTPYNWRIRTANNREEIYRIGTNERFTIPARGMANMTGTNAFLDTNASFAALIAADGKEVQRISWERSGVANAVFAFPKIPNSPFMIFTVSPNPSGNEFGREEIMMYNYTDTAVSSTGWKLRSTRGNQEQLFQYTGNVPRQTFFLCRYNVAPWLNNEGDTVLVVNPQGKVVHWVQWGKTQDDQVIYAQP